MHTDTIEQMSQQIWPPLEQIQSKDLVLRYAKGFTNRANSATVTAYSARSLPGIQNRVEKYFSDKALPASVKIDRNLGATELDNYLACNGYSMQGESLTMTTEISINSDFSTKLRQMDKRDWLNVYYGMNPQLLRYRSVHSDLLARIKGRIKFAVLQNKIRAPVSCAIAVQVENYVGLLNVCTDPCFRRQGAASRLVTGLLAWSSSNNARQAFLTVDAANTAAISLYEKLGFMTKRKCWYRTKYTQKRRENERH